MNDIYHPKDGCELKSVVLGRQSSKKGGKREGAGRKPRETPRKAITVRLEEEDTDKLRRLCKARGVSQAEWISDKIKRARK